MTESGTGLSARRVDQRPIQAFVHDVNNPLTVALVRVSLAKRRLRRGDVEQEALVGCLSDAETQLRRVAALVADLERANRQEDTVRWPPRAGGDVREADVAIRGRS